ncbi:MAG: hypothetical protein HQL47_07815, partial [Gammaproteobacteria bacterium]|nr:hypothetical protein [Gammaproteobacteria bacterium]
ITGGSIDFWAMGEDKDVARGRRYARVIVDEAAHIRYLEEAWTKAVEPTLTDFRGEAWFISTPNGLNFFHDLYQRGQRGETDWVSHQMPTTSNPHILAAEIEAKRENTPALVFSQEYLAQFVTFGGGLVKPDMIQHGT